MRAIHQTAQTMGGTFILLGFLTILSEKIEWKKTIIPESPHAILGFFTIFILTLQIFIGQQRLDQPNYNASYRKWHNDLGLLLWDLLCFTIFSGLITFLPFGLYNFLLLFTPWVIWLVVYSQIYSRTNRRDDIDRAADDYEDSLPKLSNTFGSNANLSGMEGGGIEGNDDEIADENSSFIRRTDEN